MAELKRGHKQAERGIPFLHPQRFRERQSLPGAVHNCFIEKLSAEGLSVYPDYSRVKETLSGFFRVAPEELLLTNGTDEAIHVLVNTYVDDADEVIALRPSYAMYRFYAEVAGAVLVEVPYEPPALEFPLEALLNAVRHSGAARISVRLFRDGAEVRLIVADDGSGFVPTEVDREKHFGLQLMAERVEQAEGVLRIEACPGEGTQVVARLPIESLS